MVERVAVILVDRHCPTALDMRAFKSKEVTTSHEWRLARVGFALRGAVCADWALLSAILSGFQ